MDPLHLRLAALRRRLRWVVTCRGVSWLVALLLFAAAAAGLLDWRVHLPSLLRAVLLVAAVAGASYVAYRVLLQPLLARSDDLSLALRVEEQFPAFNDCLGSALQFLTEPRRHRPEDSGSLRSQVVHEAFKLADQHDFSRAVDSRGVRAASLSMLSASLLALLLVLASPHLAWTGLVRLADPFGKHDWPRHTQLEVAARARIARGEAFEIRITLGGVIPDQAAVRYRWSESSAQEQVYEVPQVEGASTASLVAKLEAGRVQRDFRFEVVANDASSGWREVVVLPPPQLVPLDERPSPQIHLTFPAYTDLLDLDLPDGTSTVEAVVGTRVRIRGATSSPVTRAWLEYPAELSLPLGAAAAIAPLGQACPCSVTAAALAQGSTDWQHIPASLDADRRVLSLEFIARAGGLYLLRLEDDLGIVGSRLIEIRVWPDPPPGVHLERPSRSHDSLEILPRAEITLRVIAEDAQFAVRSAQLNYQVRRDGGAPTPTLAGQVALHDSDALAQTLQAVLSVLGGPRVFPLGPPLRLRPQHVVVERLWPLAGLKLQAGDVVLLQVQADDFDDVLAGKQPGRSHEIELRVVSPAHLELALNEAQARVQQELVRAQKLQQEALGQVTEAQSQPGKLPPRQLDNLLQAEQLQQQVRARVGTREEGLRAEVSRILQAMRQNRLPRSGAQDRLEIVAGELERLAREHLEQIEPRLTGARKESQLAEENAASGREAKELLGQARRHQEEVNNTLQDLLRLLEPWTSSQEIRGEAKLLLQEQRQLMQQTGKLGQALPSGQPRERLKPEQLGELDKAADAQRKLAQRTEDLLNKMEAAGKRRQAEDPPAAEALREAARVGREETDAAGRMKAAAQSLEENRVANAGVAQKESAQALEKMVQTLEDRREADLDRLIKKLRAAEQQLAELGRDQEGLQKKTRQAQELTDPAKREEELKRLAREQEKLQEEAEELLRELTRQRASRAAQSMNQAANQMRQAGARMNQGEEAQEQQEEALNRLDEAQRELEEARRDAEEELAREKRAKLADDLKALVERQEALLAESERIQRAVLQKKGWERPLRVSLRDLDRGLKTLARETLNLADDKLKGDLVFAHLLRKAADRMEEAGERMQQRLEQGRDAEDPDFNPADEIAADEETQKLQHEALRRLNQVVEALKPDTAASERRQGQREQPMPGEEQPPVNREQNDAGFPSPEQLKLLRVLQREVNERTEAFHKVHPNTDKLRDKELAELQTLRQEQQEIANLFDELTAPPVPRGPKP